jgi:hypothetical protein
MPFKGLFYEKLQKILVWFGNSIDKTSIAKATIGRIFESFQFVPEAP